MPKKWNVYCVTDGLNGLYMPNSVCYFTSQRTTIAYMASQARDLRDQEYKVSGNASDGYVYGWEDSSDPEAYALTWQVETFDTKAERDQFIADNEEM